MSEGESFQGSPYGGVAACGLEGESSIPRMLNTMPSMGTAPCHISLSADERYLFAANYSSGNVAVYPVQEDGSLEPVSDIQQHQGSSLNPGNCTVDRPKLYGEIMLHCVKHPWHRVSCLLYLSARSLA